MLLVYTRRSLRRQHVPDPRTSNSKQVNDTDESWSTALRERVACRISSDHLPGHLPGVATPVRNCAANGLVGHQSTKKPIRLFLKRCRWFLKQFTESTSNDC